MQTVKADPDTTTFYPDDDAPVDRHEPDDTHDAGGWLAVGTGTTGETYPRYHSYLKFDLSSLAGATIISAKFRLYAYASNGYRPFYIKKVADDSWTEETITWNNKKAQGATIYTGACGEGIGWKEHSHADIATYVDEEKGGDLSVAYMRIEGVGDKDYNFYRDKEYSSGSVKPELVVVYTTNADPTITSASIPDRDDGDNCYEMESYYSLIAVVNDGDGAVHISDVYIQGKQGGAVRFEVRGTSLDGVPSYSIQTGATIIDIDVGSCSWVENGDEGTLTIKIRFEWDFTDEANLEIAVYVEDADGASAGFTTMQTDYFDVLGRLVISNLAVSDGRIDRNTATDFSGDINYATTIAGNVASLKYPPNAQFTAVHIHDAAHASKGNDNTIVNGAFSGISVTVPDAVQSNTYHVYLDLVADYSDGDAPDGDTIAVIGDQIEIVSVAFDDDRVNVNTVGEVRYVLRYDFDNVAFEGGDGSIVGFSWDAGNSWWDKAVTSPANPGHDVYDENDLGALTDDNFGLTVYEDDAGSNFIGDRWKILTFTADIYNLVIGEYAELRLTAELEYDNHPLGAGDTVEINGVNLPWDAGDSRFEVSVTSGIPQRLIFDTITDGLESTFGITVGNEDGKSVSLKFVLFAPNLLFGAGFNASSPYVELHWNHSLDSTEFFEIQNSSDAISWEYLGQSNTANYTDDEVFNGTARYYRVRACNYTDEWFNSSFGHPDFEIVYFLLGVGGNGENGIMVQESDAPWIALAIILSIVAGLLFTRVKR